MAINNNYCSIYELISYDDMVLRHEIKMTDLTVTLSVETLEFELELSVFLNVPPRSASQ